MSKKEEDNHAQNCPSGAHKLSTADDNIFFFLLQLWRKRKDSIFYNNRHIMRSHIYCVFSTGITEERIDTDDGYTK